VIAAGALVSYPPHKHDTDAVPRKLSRGHYYHRLDPPRFAFSASTRRSLDRRSDDRRGSRRRHGAARLSPVIVPHGYPSYFRDVMAGPRRVWHFHNDPAHAWMLAPTE
jgi:5-deoxy-glucuronate isomerase